MSSSSSDISVNYKMVRPDGSAVIKLYHLGCKADNTSLFHKAILAGGDIHDLISDIEFLSDVIFHLNTSHNSLDISIVDEEFAHYSLDAVVMTAVPFLEFQSVL